MSNPIDHALAIWQIDPLAEYLLDQTVLPNTILEWRGLGSEPTAVELYTAWLKCTRFEVDRPVITADGVDTATVTVRTGEDETSIVIMVRDQEVIVSLSYGVGAVEIVAGIPTLEPHVVVCARDQITYGVNGVVVRAI